MGPVLIHLTKFNTSVVNSDPGIPKPQSVQPNSVIAKFIGQAILARSNYDIIIATVKIFAVRFDSLLDQNFLTKIKCSSQPYIC